MAPACSSLLLPVGGRQPLRSWADRWQPPLQRRSLGPASHKRLEVRCESNEEGENQRPLYGDFVRRPLVSPYKRTAACRRCSGTGCVPCGQCGGRGWLAKGGYQKRNPVSAARVIGSKWTAMERTFGWRHFRVIQKRGQGKDTFVLMAATCDESTQLWINMQNLKDRQRWASGWLQKADILALEQQRQALLEGQEAGGGSGQPVAAARGADCKACGSSGTVTCPLCSLAGQVVEL